MESDQEPDGNASGFGSHGSSLRDLPRLRAGSRRRSSSWDRSGGNDDWVNLEPGGTMVLLDAEGAGNISHLWICVPEATGYKQAEADSMNPDVLQRAVLEMRWDGEEDPSVLVPLGAFFGGLHIETTEFISAPIQVGPRDARSFTSFFHMPFSSGARVEIRSECDEQIQIWFYVDYEEFDHLEPDVARFHASWNRARFDGEPQKEMSNEDYLFGGSHLSADGNYVVLDTEGQGHYVGCFFSVQNLRRTHEWNWYGEGDDMIFIDGDGWPPTLHGTGVEDYFDTTWCPQKEHASAYHGLIRGGGENWSGVSTYYRFHIEDPVTFRKSIKVTFEHGHANRRPDEITSVAFWYQTEPHRPLTLPAADDRVPEPL